MQLELQSTLVVILCPVLKNLDVLKNKFQSRNYNCNLQPFRKIFFSLEGPGRFPETIIIKQGVIVFDPFCMCEEFILGIRFVSIY